MAKPTTPPSPPPKPVKGNFAPVADDETFSIGEDSAFKFLTASLLDGDTDQNKDDVLSVQSVQNAVNGTVTLNGTSVLFVPDPNFFGQASFEYTVSDGKGGADTGLVTVIVNSVNDAPLVSGAVMGSAVEDGPVVVLNGLSNASDVEGSTLSIVGLPASLPDGVSFDAATSTFSLDPAHATYQSLADGQTATVSVDYGVSDGGLTSQASVSWQVAGADEAPVAISVGVFGAGDDFSSPNWQNISQNVVSDLSGLDVFSSVTLLNGYEPLATLSQYDAILLYTNGPANRAGFFDTLADFVDAGGGLVVATFAFQAINYPGSSEDLERLETGGYLPLEDYFGNYSVGTLGAYEADHSIMQGPFQVNDLSHFYRDFTSLAADAELVASWSDGWPLVAVDSSGVVGVSYFPNDEPGEYGNDPLPTGDYIELLGNALVYAAAWA